MSSPLKEPLLFYAKVSLFSLLCVHFLAPSLPDTNSMEGVYDPEETQ